MSPILRFLFSRLISIPLTFVVITSVLYAGVMLSPPETRATLYLPKRLSSRMTDAQFENLIQQIIERHHLNKPFPVQYVSWLSSLFSGTWGYSPTLQDDVLSALLQRTPATAELALFSLLLFIPFGLFSGVLASTHYQRAGDSLFRLLAFVATSFPTFILALVLLALFYVSLRWFPPERLGMEIGFVVTDPGFHNYTGLLTIDGLLNSRMDVTLDALRHLVLPVFTLSLAHWATLARVMRVSMLDEYGKEYILAARARGISQRSVAWKHALRNALAPALASTALSAATLVTGVFVVEIIYNFHGVSDLIVRGLTTTPDAPAALGFAVYSVLVVLVLMFVLDLVQVIIDPRFRQ